MGSISVSKVGPGVYKKLTEHIHGSKAIKLWSFMFPTIKFPALSSWLTFLTYGLEERNSLLHMLILIMTIVKATKKQIKTVDYWQDLDSFPSLFSVHKSGLVLNC